MVLPARVGDVNGGARDDASGSGRRRPEGTGAAEGLGGDDTAVTDDGAVGAEEQVLHGAVVGDRAFDGLVARGGRLRGGPFGGARRRAGDLAVVVEVRANAEVDLLLRLSALKASFRPRIGSRGHFHRSKDRRASWILHRGEGAVRRSAAAG